MQAAYDTVVAGGWAALKGEGEKAMKEIFNINTKRSMILWQFISSVLLTLKVKTAKLVAQRLFSSFSNYLKKSSDYYALEVSFFFFFHRKKNCLHRMALSKTRMTSVSKPFVVGRYPLETFNTLAACLTVSVEIVWLFVLAKSSFFITGSFFGKEFWL